MRGEDGANLEQYIKFVYTTTCRDNLCFTGAKMIEYRKATVSEIDTLAKIRVDFLREANNIANDEDEEVLFQSNREYMAVSIDEGSFVAWVAVDGDRIIATSGVSFFTLPPNKSCPTGKTAYISNMYTYPPYRNQGIATRLFDLTVKEARSNGSFKILLNATPMGKSIYEKYGFKETENEMIYHVL